MKPLRFDLVFSYWIYLWFLLYTFKITSFSPKFPLILGLIDNIIMFVLMLVYDTTKEIIVNFLLINTVIKAIPLYYLRNEPIQLEDIYFTILLFIVFIFWLHLNSQSLIGNIKIVHDSLLYGQNKTPFMDILNKIKNNFKKLRVI